MLAVAEERVGQIAAQAHESPPWNYYYTPAFWTLQRGLIYSYIKGRTHLAADLLIAGMAALPAEQRDAEWAEDYRRALAEVQAEL
jgi:hypothetical protein